MFHTGLKDEALLYQPNTVSSYFVTVTFEKTGAIVIEVH